MNAISACYDVTGVGELTLVPVDQVAFITIQNRMLCLHTLDGKNYYIPNTLDMMFNSLAASGTPNFEMMDRCSIVNADNIFDIDEYWSIVYFDKEHKLKCNISERSYHRLRKKFKQMR